MRSKRKSLRKSVVVSFIIAVAITLIASILGFYLFVVSSVLAALVNIGVLSLEPVVLLSGLLTGSGLGILLLFKSNKNMKENLTILLIIYFVGVFVGTLVDLIG